MNLFMITLAYMRALPEALNINQLTEIALFNRFASVDAGGSTGHWSL